MFLRKLKSYIRQKYLKYKFAKRNIVGKNVIFSKDTVIDSDVFIGANSIIEFGVRLYKKVRIGKNVRLSNITVGENSVIEAGVICTGYGNGTIKIGQESYIGLRNILDCNDNITIGSYVHIAGPSSGL